MSVNDIKTKLKSGVYKLINKSNAKSEVWNVFEMIIDEKKEFVTGFVACKFCFQVLVFDSHKTGTSSLRKHKCNKKEAMSVKSVASFFVETTDVTKTLVEVRDLTRKKEDECIPKDNQLLHSISAKLKRGVYKLVNKSNAKSDVWTIFEEIFNENDELIKGVVACKCCFHVLVFDSHKTGTSSLRKHKCKAYPVRALKSSSGSTISLKIPTEDEKDLIANMLVKYKCKDIRSFKSTSSEGFMELAQSFINIGAFSGHVDILMLLPDPITLPWHIKKLAMELRSEISSELKTLNNISGAITFGMWIDDYRKNEYLCLKLHFIDDSWSLKERVLYATQRNSYLNEKADDMKSVICHSLQRYGLEHLFHDLVYVTDNSLNIISTFETITHLPCFVNLINEILNETFELESEVKCENNLWNLKYAINSTISLVTYFQEFSLQNFLQTALKVPVGMRWNSIYDMFESVYSQYEEIKQILIERYEDHRLSDLNSIKNIIIFLEQFKNTLNALECSKAKPSLHLPLVWFKRLHRYLQPAYDDEEIIYELKMVCLNIFQAKFHPHLLHKIALFLHPKLKSLKLLNDEKERTEIRNEIKMLINQKIEIVKIESDNSEQLLRKFLYTNIIATCPNKRRKVDDTLSDVEDSSDENSDDVPNEMQAYINLKICRLSDNEEDFHVLQWWQNHSAFYPNLANLARMVFSIPCCASDETYFSTAGFDIQEQRDQLHPDAVDDILFLHCNLHKNN